MWTGGFVDRVQATRVVVGADAGEIDRCQQKGLAHAFTVFIVVGHVTFLVLVTEGIEGLAAVGKGGGEDGAVAVLFAIQVEFFVDDVECVTLARVLHEVDDAAENIGQVQDQGIGEPGVLACHEQGRGNLGTDPGFMQFGLAKLPLCCKAGVGAPVGNGLQRRDDVPHSLQGTVACGFKGDDLPRVDSRQGLAFRRLVDYPVDISIAEAGALEDQ